MKEIVCTAVLRSDTVVSYREMARAKAGASECCGCLHRWARPLLRPCFLLPGVLLLLLSACAPIEQDYAAFVPEADKYRVRILRDTLGVPHIYGATDADAAYGLAWAHCEDDWIHMEEAMLTARGELARKLGRNWAKFDYLTAWFRVREFASDGYDTELSPELRAVVEAYAEAITHFAALHPDKMPHLVLPVTGHDIIAGVMLKAPFFYELHRSLIELLDEDGVDIDKGGVVALRALEDNPFSRGLPIGSNAWAVGPARSADGATRLAINSHMPWEGQVTWYEAHVASEEGWDIIGATFPGGPFIFKGHNENMGWCHTINRPGLADIYELTMHPEDPYRYMFDGEWRELERETVRMRVRLWGNLVVPVSREALWSVHGPAVRQGDRVLALRFAGYGDLQILEQWRMMNRAQNIEEFLEAMRMNTMLSFNTVYADREGNLLYVYGGKFPVRNTAFDWNAFLPGDTSETLWTEFYTFDDLPQVLNPASAFVQSCNNSPFYTTVGADNPKPEDFCHTMRIETQHTNRSRRALALYGTDESITRERFVEYKYDKTYDPESWVGRWLRQVREAELPDDADMREAVAILEEWTLTAERDDVGTALAVLAMELGPAEDAPRDETEALRRLRNAVRFLRKHHGRLDVHWQEMLRLRRGEYDLPLAGCPDCLRAIDVRVTDDGRFAGINGDCFIQMVEWFPDGTMHSESVHQYGAAVVDEESPHYADQAPLFADEAMRPSLYHEAEIRANLVREYRPGTFAGPWYAQ